MVKGGGGGAGCCAGSERATTRRHANAPPCTVNRRQVRLHMSPRGKRTPSKYMMARHSCCTCPVQWRGVAGENG
jgi:hypothetical protein